MLSSPCWKRKKKMGASNGKEAFRTAVLDLVNNQQVSEERDSRTVYSSALRTCRKHAMDRHVCMFGVHHVIISFSVNYHTR